jgi:hypothetical protein
MSVAPDSPFVPVPQLLQGVAVRSDTCVPMGGDWYHQETAAKGRESSRTTHRSGDVDVGRGGRATHALACPELTIGIAICAPVDTQQVHSKYTAGA